MILILRFFFSLQASAFPFIASPCSAHILHTNNIQISMTVLLVAISKTLLATLLLQQIFICEVAGQEPQAVHPWRQDCDQFGCYIDYYCTYEEGICTKCPNDGVGTTEEDCRKDHKEFTGADLEGLNNATNTAVVTSNYTQMNIDDCIANCIRAQVEEECSESNPCEERNSFCRYDTTEETLPEDEGTEGSDETAAKNYGQCEPCKAQIVDCISEANRDSPLSPFTAEECVLSCDIRVCVPMHFSVVSKETKEDSVKVDSNAMQGSPEAVITGNLVPCSNLILDGERECSKDAEGSICLVEDYTRNTYFIDVVHKCAELGGIGVVFFGDKNPQTANNQTWSGSLSYQPSAIPSVIVSFDEGKAWETTIREENNDMQIAINVTTVGDACIKRQFCSVSAKAEVTTSCLSLKKFSSSSAFLFWPINHIGGSSLHWKQ